MEKTTITIQANILAERKKTWDCYTQPEHIVNWNFASEDWHCPSASNDLSVGGKYSARMEAKDGSLSFDFEAIYDQVIEEDKIAFTMLDGRKVEIGFSGVGQTTRVTITFEAEDQNPVDLQQQGWQAILDQFKKYTESL